MNYHLKFSPSATEKLQDLKTYLSEVYGTQVAKRIITNIIEECKDLQFNPRMGPSIESLLGIDTSYRYIYVERNYIFYSIGYDTIYVIDIFNEREDIMQKMFGVNTTNRDSDDFWDE